MRPQHRGVLVAEHELDLAVLPRLEARARSKVRPDRAVLRRRHRREHVPRMHQLLEDARHARQHLEGRWQIGRRDGPARRFQLVQGQLHPQLARLVLDDEEQLVRVGRARMLGGEHRVQREIVTVAHVVACGRVHDKFLAARCGGACSGRSALRSCDLAKLLEAFLAPALRVQDLSQGGGSVHRVDVPHIQRRKTETQYVRRAEVADDTLLDERLHHRVRLRVCKADLAAALRGRAG